MIIDVDSVLVLSIVVPVYNGEMLLPDCLRSIGGAVARVPLANRAQIEVIVCDNLSTDNTREISERFDPGCSYRVIQPSEHFPNRTDNWNYGLRHATGDWVMMLHHDDLLSDGSLVGIMDAIRSPESDNATIISGRHRIIDLDGRANRLRPMFRHRTRLRRRVLQRDILPFYCIFIPFTPFRRAAFDKIGPMNRDYQLLQDWDFWLRMAGEGDAIYIPKELGWWRAHTFSEQYSIRFAQEMLLFCERLLASKEPVLSKRAEELIVKFHAYRARSFAPNISIEVLTALTANHIRWIEVLTDPMPIATRSAARYFQWKLQKERVIQSILCALTPRK